MTFDEAKNALYGMISEKRYVHSMLVVQTAELLAQQYGENAARTRWAALLHDCAKGLSAGESMAMAESFGIAFDEVTQNEPNLVHAPLGAILAKEIFRIDDEAVLSAIRWHTTGRAGMTLLEKSCTFRTPSSQTGIMKGFTSCGASFSRIWTGRCSITPTIRSRISSRPAGCFTEIQLTQGTI